MRFRIGRKASSSNKKAAAAADGNRPASSVAAAAAAPADARNADGGGVMIVASPYHNGAENGSQCFFDARQWLDSDSEDDFHRESGGSASDQRQTSFTARVSVDRLMPSMIQKRPRLLELLEQQQQYDDEHDRAHVSSEMQNSSAHAKEHLKSSVEGKKPKKSSKAGCLPSSFWKLSFKNCRKSKEG